MFVKKSWRTTEGKKYTSHEIVKSYRPSAGANPRHEVLANISFLPIETIKKIAILLKSPKAEVIKDLNSFFKETYTYGAIMFFYLLMEKIGIIKAMAGIPRVSKKMMIAVIINRIMDARSKLGSVDWIKGTAFSYLFDIEKDELKVNQIYKSMDVFFRKMDEVMSKFFEGNKRGTKFLLYDVTSTFFEGEGPKEIAKQGYSRDKRGDRPQILIALCLNENRLPVYFDIFAGNIQDKKTVIPIIEKIKKDFDAAECIFVGDRGMVSVDNLERITEERLYYIVALTHKEARKLLWEKKIERELFDKELPIMIRIEGEERKYVLCGSEYRKEHDLKVLNKLLEKGKASLEGVRKMVENGYVKDHTKTIRRAQKRLTKSNGEKFYDFSYKEGKFEIIENKEYIDMAKNLCGYYVLESTKVDMPDKEVEEHYKGLKFVERAFRELKEVVEIRPVFHWKERRVRVHIFLCILAQALVNKCMQILKESKWLDKDKNYSFRYFLDILSRIELGIFEIEDAREKIISELDEEQIEILKIFDMNLKWFKNPCKQIVV